MIIEHLPTQSFLPLAGNPSIIKLRFQLDLDEELGEKNHTLGSKLYGFFKLFLINYVQKLFLLIWQKLKGEKYPCENVKKNHKTQIPLDLDEELGGKNILWAQKVVDHSLLIM